MRKLGLFVLILPLLIGGLIPNAVHASTTETLRPNEDGIYHEFWFPDPLYNTHWNLVDDVIPDDDATHISFYGQGYGVWFKDTFKLPDIPSDAIVSKVEVYGRARGSDVWWAGSAMKIMIRTYSTDYFGAEITLPLGWNTYSYVETNNPNTGLSWTADEVNALEAGVSVCGWGGFWPGITQVYVEVTYELPAPELPVASFKESAETVTVGDAISFDASASYDPDGGDIVLYEWDFDSDGVIDATGVTATHAYAATGTYTVTLTVTDDEGQTGTATAIKTVEAPPPPPPPGPGVPEFGFSVTMITSLVAALYLVLRKRYTK